MRVKFLRDRDWTPAEDRRRIGVSAAGSEETIKRSWGEQLVADGDAEEIKAQPRPVTPQSEVE